MWGGGKYAQNHKMSFILLKKEGIYRKKLWTTISLQRVIHSAKFRFKKKVDYYTAENDDN